MDHLDELRVATASSLPLNGLAPRTYARDHATFEALSNQRGLIADWLVDRLSSSRTAPLSVLTVGCGGGALELVHAGWERLRGGSSCWFAQVRRFCGRRPWLSVRCAAWMPAGTDI